MLWSLLMRSYASNVTIPFARCSILAVYLAAASLLTYAAVWPGQAQAQSVAHPLPGIWSFRNATGPITDKERALTCLRETAVTHRDGLLVLWTRRKSDFSLDFGKPYFNPPTYSQCLVDADNVEICTPLDANGKPSDGGTETKSKLTRLAGGSLSFCEFSPEKGRFETGGECAELLACPLSLFAIKGPGWRLTLDIMQRPGSATVE